ncbi:MAG: TetR/AcrR family transcriptional regulator [Streptosporangiaceae bacterium]
MGESKVEAVIWAREPKPARGPQPAYSLDQISDAAIRIADSDGLDALTMRRLAAEIGAGVMSLYRYVSGRTDIIDLMSDRVLREIELKPYEDWRSGLQWLAQTTREHIHRHPWLVHLPGNAAPFGPHGLALTEHVMGIMDGLGLNIDEMMTSVGLVSGYVSSSVQSEIATRERLRQVGMTMEDWMRVNAPYIRKLLDSGKYPMMERIIIDARWPHMDPEEAFDYGLQRVLSGIAATVEGSSG